MTTLWLETRVLTLDAPMPDDVISVVHVVNFLPANKTMRAVVMTRRSEPTLIEGNGDPLDPFNLTIENGIDQMTAGLEEE